MIKGSATGAKKAKEAKASNSGDSNLNHCPDHWYFTVVEALTYPRPPKNGCVGCREIWEKANGNG